jgi:hypothetical protein
MCDKGKSYINSLLSFRLFPRTWMQVSRSTLNGFFFPDIPSHYPLHKKIQITRSSTATGAWWDTLQILMTFATCITYVWSTFPISLATTNIFYSLDLVITQFFVMEFFLNWYLTEFRVYFTDPVTFVDLLSIVPVYVSLFHPSTYTNTDLLQCFRILRLVRIFKGFKLMRNFSGVRRQVLNLTVILLSAMFLAAGIIQIIENQQHGEHCTFINADTNWEPSCSPDAPADQYCECYTHNCRGFYIPGDTQGEMSGVTCQKLTFFDSFYFIVVTLSTVGYGHITPTTAMSKLFMIIFVVACLVIIPMSVSRLQKLLGLQSPYRRPYVRNEGEQHIVVCGHVNDANKLNRFFREFFHEDRLSEVEYHAVILSPQEPTEDVRSLLSGSVLGSRVSYVIGTAMASEDLKRAKADSARCMFFLCNTEVKKGTETSEDAATILRSLSVSNFNSSLECLVQVLRPEERVILKDSDVDCILCLDEFKTVLQARNAVCPGFSTFIENIFHSVEDVPDDSPLQKVMAPWYKEYLHGAGMELYFVELNFNFLRHTQFSFSIISDTIYYEFGCVSLGMCNKQRDSVVFNPRLKDLTNYANLKDFYRAYNVLLILADDQNQADSIGKALNDQLNIARLTMELNKKREEEWDIDDGSDDDNDSESDVEDDESKYMGFASYRKANEAKMDAEETAGFPEVASIKGPCIDQVPRVPKPGIPQKKTRLIPAVQAADAAERRLTASHFAPVPFLLGQASATLKDASNLRNHVVVFGCDTYLSMFISELRRPAVTGESYHPIVIIAENEPPGWDKVLDRYNDLYYVKASMNKQTVSSKANLEHAFSLIFLAPRDNVTHDDENKDSIDAVALFAFLKLEQLIPSNVFCSIELNSSGNMAVLNATIMKRARRLQLDDNRRELRRKQKAEQVDQFNSARQRAKETLERRGSAVSSRRSFSSSSQTFGYQSADARETQLISDSELAGLKEKTLWEAIDNHYIFPVYASARVFVPSSFETLLVQSFFVKLTPVICERFICGQLSQTVMQVSMPDNLIGRSFLEVYRVFSSCGVVALGLYRAPSVEMGALLPYVFNAPPPESIMYKRDKIFLFGATKNVDKAIAKANRAVYV